MIKIFSATAVAVAAFVATPAAAAAPTGGRVEALIGYDVASASGVDDGGMLFGAGAGYDFAFSSAFSLGADVEVTGSTTDIGVLEAGRDLYAGGRLTTAISDKTNLYFKAGYTNGRVQVDGLGGTNLDGVRVGAGLQYAIGGKSYVGGEYRYSNYEAAVSRHQVALTVGTRF